MWQLDGGHRPPCPPICVTDSRKPHISHTDNKQTPPHGPRQTPGAIVAKTEHTFDNRTYVLWIKSPIISVMSSSYTQGWGKNCG